MFVCDPSSPHNIDALNRGGCHAIGGVNDIRAGIDRQIELFKTDRFFIFEDENPYGLDEYSTYHYGEPKELKMMMMQKSNYLLNHMIMVLTQIGTLQCI